MILRSITKHVKDQNWFAVFLDFFIVVVGILIAFQITTWNEERVAKIDERAVMNQLQVEFIVIKSELEKQIELRDSWIEHLSTLIQILEGDIEEDPKAVRVGLVRGMGAGRRPAQLSAYLQLMASGGLSLLRNEALRRALIDYDVRLKRDEFLQPVLVEEVIEEVQNPHRDLNVLWRNRGAAAIDDSPAQSLEEGREIESYDLQALKQFVPRYELMYTLHIHIITAEEVQLGIANEVLAQIANELE